MALYPHMCHSQIQLEMVKSKGMKVPEKAMGENSHEPRVGKATTFPLMSLHLAQTSNNPADVGPSGCEGPTASRSLVSPTEHKGLTPHPAALQPLISRAFSPRHGPVSLPEPLQRPPRGRAGRLRLYLHPRTYV